MASIVMGTVVHNFGFRISNYLTNGTVEKHDFFKDDEITNLAYASKDAESGIAKATGRITGIHLDLNSAGIVEITDIVVDSSEKYNSILTVIDPKEVLEFNASGEVRKVTVTPIIKGKYVSKLSDETETSMELEIGKELYNVTISYPSGSEITFDCKIKNFVYVKTNTNEYGIKMIGIYLDSNSTIYTLPFDLIKKCGKAGVVIESPDAVKDALSDPSIGGVTLPKGEITETIELTTNKVVKGTKAEVAANAGPRCTPEISEDETVVTAVVSCAKDTEVSVKGIAVTGNAYVELNDAKSAEFSNCKFVECEPYQEKSYLYKTAVATPTDLQLSGNYFGDNKVSEGKAYYNLFELNCKLKDGTTIANNYFTKDCCNHNMINIYDVEDGATINIENNHFEYSGNAIRIGIKGDPHATINIKNNTYDTTDESENGAYAGLLLIQPYGQQTTSMAHVTINIDGTVNNSGVEQLYYLYAGENDMQFTEENKPKIYVNGVLQK